MQLKPFIYEQWHCWQGQASILLSDEENKRLFSFKDVNEAINALFNWGNEAAARALNKHIKPKEAQS